MKRLKEPQIFDKLCITWQIMFDIFNIKYSLQQVTEVKCVLKNIFYFIFQRFIYVTAKQVTVLSVHTSFNKIRDEGEKIYLLKNICATFQGIENFRLITDSCE